MSLYRMVCIQTIDQTSVHYRRMHSLQLLMDTHHSIPPSHHINNTQTQPLSLSLHLGPTPLAPHRSATGGTQRRAPKAASLSILGFP